MEAFEESNCHSMSDSFSLYERYLRTFNVVESFMEENITPGATEQVSSRISNGAHTHSVGNLDLISHKDLQHPTASESAFSSVNEDHNETNTIDKKYIRSETGLHAKVSFPCALLDGGSLLEHSSITEESDLTEKSDPIDVPVSSEDSKSESSKHPKPVIITSLITMENSNNAVDSVPLFRDVRHSESVFKLPMTELTFNGTLKHVQKLKPIFDPRSALTSNLVSEAEIVEEAALSDNSSSSSELKSESNQTSDVSEDANRSEVTESTGDSQYEEFNPRKEVSVEEDSCKWNEQSLSSLEASFDSGVRSPDMFSDDEGGVECVAAEPENFWHFLKDYEAHDKFKIRKMEDTLQGVLPPPSVTIIKTDITEMLKKYYCFLPAFSEDANSSNPEVNSTTPTKRTSYIRIPTDTKLPEILQETTNNVNISDKNPVQIGEAPDVNPIEAELIERPTSRCSLSKESVKAELEVNTSVSEKNIILKMCTETQAKETAWPDILKCRYYGTHYNVTKYSERMELLALRCGERYVGAETDSSVTVFSGGLHSPSSANKRKALRLKMAQAKSPGRRLSHLARRRQAFCSAATIGEKGHASNSKMVLIDKNFFPHRKLINSSEWKSPRIRRTPGKRTPGRKTPGKKTPGKTPKTRSGGSSRKKAMRRLLMDPETLSRSQPTRETSKRALFISPENRKLMPQMPSTSVPLQAMKSKRALFGSPDRQAETKSLDGTASDQFLKRKRSMLDDTMEDRRSKIAKSLSFGGEVSSLQAGSCVSRRASEMFATKGNMADLDQLHKKKLLWAVTEALRVHGWRMQSPGFTEKASSLARLTRRLLTLPPHAARLAAPKLSTSETMLKIARQYVFAIIQGRSVDDCFEEEKAKLANEGNQKVTGYISASAYQQIRARQPSTSNHSQIKENTCDGIKQELQRSGSKNILQDKLLNVDTNSNSNSSSGLSMLEKTGLYKSNSMPSFEEAAKMRARRQISFDNVDFPKR